MWLKPPLEVQWLTPLLPDVQNVPCACGLQIKGLRLHVLAAATQITQLPLSSGLLWLIYTGMLWTWTMKYDVFWCFIDVLDVFVDALWCVLISILMFDDVFWRSKFLDSWNAVDVQSASRWSQALLVIFWSLGLWESSWFPVTPRASLPCSPC